MIEVLIPGGPPPGISYSTPETPIMNDRLERYLNDHLAGSHSAIAVIQDLAERQEDPRHRIFFEQLKEDVEEDQKVLTSLLERGGMKERGVQKAAGKVTAQASRLKLKWEGMEPGELGTFEALEMLALGIQGKRVLWIMLNEIASLFPEWAGIDFRSLESRAREQREAVEKRRIVAGREVLAVPMLQGG